ncbi:MAG: hypothetical protein QNI99_08870 [Woeseiaceae bacterium]|nr:hypothetical protein [Woeseiaceae bacterium]
MTKLRALSIALFCCLPLSGIQAEESAHGFVLLIDEDAPGASAMVAGRFDEAVDAATSARMHADEVGASTVACAALIAQRDLDAADEACDRAVELAQRPITTVYNPRGHADREALAMSYSNRAVLRSLRGDATGAAADIERALRQNRYEADVAHNRQVSASNIVARSD